MILRRCTVAEVVKIFLDNLLRVLTSFEPFFLLLLGGTIHWTWKEWRGIQREREAGRVVRKLVYFRLFVKFCHVVLVLDMGTTFWPAISEWQEEFQKEAHDFLFPPDEAVCESGYCLLCMD